MRLKIEINTREHLAGVDPIRKSFTVDAPWFSGTAEVVTFRIETLLGTKLRALYQRKKGRDLYDLWLALTTLEVDDAEVVRWFARYLAHEGAVVSRAQFEANLTGKLADQEFIKDVAVLLPTGQTYDAAAADRLVRERLVGRLAGEPWRGRQG